MANFIHPSLVGPDGRVEIIEDGQKKRVWPCDAAEIMRIKPGVVTAEKPAKTLAEAHAEEMDRSDYERLERDQLVTIATARGIVVSPGLKPSEIIDMLLDEPEEPDDGEDEGEDD